MTIGINDASTKHAFVILSIVLHKECVVDAVHVITTVI